MKGIFSEPNSQVVLIGKVWANRLTYFLQRDINVFMFKHKIFQPQMMRIIFLARNLFSK